MIRAFLAVELSEDFRNQIARIQQDLKTSLARELPRVVHLSWVRPASIHLTIKFLGDIDDDLPRLFRVGRPVDMAAELVNRGFELFEIAVEMGEGVLLDALGMIAKLAAVAECRVAAPVAGQERIGKPSQRRLQRLGVGMSRLGTSEAVALGAYAYALRQLG